MITSATDLQRYNAQSDNSLISSCLLRQPVQLLVISILHQSSVNGNSKYVSVCQIKGIFDMFYLVLIIAVEQYGDHIKAGRVSHVGGFWQAR